ncbi:MAG: UDP-N-acetylmuramate--L-alanine ligase [Firmicutes bacterium ADurb.Bin193]|nr:MAG: UDP-N-acetylmuramate--L-alanine ligase [Firmicutes bacterium ADurb.Bin193]
MTVNRIHKNVHFIGIGGISMSALAHIMINGGAKVSGSDIADSPIVSRLRTAGAKINIGHSADNIENPDLVVYTAAVSKDNPELLQAKNMGIEIMERADFLGEIMKDFELPIAISGTHGKTTTTSMLSCVLLHAGLDPTVLVGGEFAQINGNYRIGSGKHLVFEACEYVDSFLKFNPFAAIILNIEEDHLDYFSGIEQIKKSFNKFMRKIPQNGFVVLNSDDKNVVRAAEGIDCTKVTYGTNGDYRAEDIEFSNDGAARFTVLYEDEGRKKRRTIRLGIKGIHNVSNALAVFAAAHTLGIDSEKIVSGIESFTGTKRRFEYKGEVNGAAVYDDYAHHPTEVAATISAAGVIPHSKLWCVFQPHTYSRTKALLDDFAKELSRADRVIITDIYAAREKNDGKTHAKLLADKIKNAEYISTFGEIAEYLKANVSKGDIVLTLGAGTITDLSGLLV